MLTKITQEQINEVFKRYHRQYEGVKEDYFGLLFVSNKFKLKVEDASQFIAFGGKDYGIDGFYFDEEKRNLYLYQFKWSMDHMLFKDSFKRLIGNGIELIFGSSSQDRYQNQVIVELKSCIQENKDFINRILIQFVFNGDPKKAEQSTVLASLREDLESKFDYRLKNFLNREVDFIFQYVSNEKSISSIVQIKKHSRYEIPFDAHLNFKSENNQLLIIFIPITTLLEMYTDLGERLFDKNIRSGLGDGKATNKEIKKGLKKIISGEEPSENFTFYHNGISITTKEDMVIDEKENKVLMVEPRVLNGAQTVKTLHNFVEENKTDTRLTEKLRSIKVMARIIKSTDNNFLTQVTINNNRQNSIEPWNLRANDEIQLTWEDRFREELHLYYERRENAFSNLSDQELEELGIIEYDAIEITHFAKTLLAWQGKTDKMSRIGEVFENENFYNETFKSKYFDTDIRKIILFYKIGCKITAIKNEILRKGYNKYSYIGKATNLIWALLIQGLVNDAKFDKYLEKYGTSLGIEGEYNTLLKNIASRKIRTIISKTLGKEKYKEYLETEKYSFLRSNSTYDDCMDTARKLYRWDKNNF